MDFTVADTYGAVSDLMRFETDVVSGVKRLVEHCKSLCPDPVWDEIAALDCRGDSASLKRWLHDLLEAEIPESNIVAFFFGIFDEAAPRHTSQKGGIPIPKFCVPSR